MDIKINELLELVDSKLEDYEETIEGLKIERFNQEYRKNLTIDNIDKKKLFDRFSAFSYFTDCETLLFIITVIVIAIIRTVLTTAFGVSFPINAFLITIGADLGLTMIVSAIATAVYSDYIKNLNVDSEQIRRSAEIIDYCNKRIEELTIRMSKLDDIKEELENFNNNMDNSVSRSLNKINQEFESIISKENDKSLILTPKKN